MSQGSIGIDEVGRGAWAGPLLVVAVRLRGVLPDGLKDSKKLTKKRREQLKSEIETAFDVGLGWVDNHMIDTIGITESMRTAVDLALKAIKAGHEEKIIMDGTINYCSDQYSNVLCVTKADDTFPIVSAASIYAKVSRDQLMAKYSLDFPQYSFEKHVGYGTAVHSKAISEYGITSLHRRSFKPIKEIVSGY